ncbi:MAG: hypothetical protein INH41_22125 [Myxococcaceae bacterium]|jgi:Tfp pilus assembly protein PilV|nr:hypothetical protein [Myxococcaceae bacterium]MCA3015093.1 hypothetical protein [Myxococcaceae bacterium]
MRTRRARGTTLLETMMAGAVLMLGLVGVVQLIISSMNQFGNSTARMTGQVANADAMADVLSMPFQAYSTFPLGSVIDGGVTTDASGRQYARTITIAAAGDGGVAARLVTVETRWRENLGPATVNRVARSSIFISELPDAGP